MELDLLVIEVVVVVMVIGHHWRCLVFVVGDWCESMMFYLSTYLQVGW